MKIIATILLLLTSLSLPSWAQTSSVDSLKAELRKQQLTVNWQDDEATRAKHELAMLGWERKFQRMELAHERVLSSIWLTGFIVLVFVCGLLVILYRQRKKSEQVQFQKRKELEHITGEIINHQREIKNGSEQLNAALLELQSQNELLENLHAEKNELMAITAHDLKNPIGSILGLSEMMLQEDTTDDERMRCASLISTTSRKMIKLVSDLLDVEQLEADEFQISVSNVNISEAVESAVLDNLQRAKKKSISIHYTPEEQQYIALADYKSVIQIADNLISNATKFSHSGSNVYVDVQKVKDHVRFIVRDEGPGLTVFDKKHLFEKFARLSAIPTGGEYSTGLGLYIVKKHVDALQGSIRVTSIEGEGTTFMVDLPVAPELHLEAVCEATAC
jgi:signal transduction histidine kinase